MNFSMYIFKVVIGFLSVCLSTTLFAQTDPDVLFQMEQMLEQNASDAGEEEVDLTELTESFHNLISTPLHLNKATFQDLSEAGLFTSFQIDNLMHHREKYGPLLAVAELQVVNGFEENFIRQIIPFITVGKSVDEPNASFGRMLNEGKHTLISRIQWIPEMKRGFINENGTPKYAGDRFSIYSRYKFSFMKKMSWCLLGEKDAGEQFFKGNQRNGFDFYSAHFALRNTGPFNIIVVGDYQLEYGQGLTLWTGLSSGKSTDPSMIMKNGIGIKPYTSSNEVFFKRGVAASVKIKKMNVDGFISYKKLDGNLESVGDTLSGEDYFTSFQESGFHRTESEIADKHSISELFYGGRIAFANRRFRTGITGSVSHYSVPYSKNIQPYNQFDFSGSSITSSGIDFAWLYRNMNVFGEVTTDNQGVFAFVSGVVMSLDPKLTVSLLYRNYPVKFQNLYSAAFRESGNNANEKGFYGGMSFKPFHQLTVICSYDRFYFPWLKYRTNAPGDGSEFSGTISYKPSRKSEFYIRYRESLKGINSSNDDLVVKYIVPVQQRGIRFHLTTKVSKLFTLRSRIETVAYKKETNNETGIVVFQDVQFHPMGFPVSWNIRYALFDSDSYDSRIYAYENDVLYGYSIPAYYYKGSRIYFNTRIKIRSGIDCWVRYSATFYSNRKVIGSGWEEIAGSRKSEFKFQIRFDI